MGMQAGMAMTPASMADTTDVQRGHYLAIAGDCVACHTAVGGKPYAGGLSTMTPIGAVVSSNITPSRLHGIGGYTEQQFSDAVRKGIRADGAHLYPVMPYTEYAQLTDADVKLLYAYFMHAVPAVDDKPPQTHLPFPFNLRLSMAGWNLLFLDRHPFVPNPARTVQWNRGAYLVRGPAHCGTCHTPRNLLMAETPSAALAGSAVGTWFAPNISNDVRSGIGNWSEQDIVDYLQLGHAPGKAQAAGPMVEAIDNSLRHLTPADLHAMAVYLKTVPAHHDPGDTGSVDAWGSPYADLASLRGESLPKDPQQMTGPQLYDAYCASCHQDRGQGSFDGDLPPLFHNTATGRLNTDNLVMVMLGGIDWRTDGSGTRMPGFASALSDRQIATLGNYLTLHFGNPAAHVTPTQVAALRAGGAPSHLVALARIGLLLALMAIIAVAGWCVRRFRRRHPQRPAG
ncbi:MAG: cytochrome c [Proteobacteria bacterium]|nr:cytochrome c [Pseudomonadota bacterium]MBS0462976.1 cytochrome c [Pseudomonadota bacterium]MBS0463912.1 cytochrome c [Pseudomonadota bacterium]